MRIVSVLEATSLTALEPDLSDRSGRKASEQSYNADQFVRCAACWCWFDRSNVVSVSEHRGPLPHPVLNLRAAWADDDA